jgi:glycogen(starch) synthase
MRLLIFSSRYVPMIGGIEVLLAQLLPGLRAAGHEVHVITSARPGAAATEEIDGVTIHRLALDEALVARDLTAVLGAERAIVELRGALRPDVIHVHDPGGAAWFQLRTRGDDRTPIVLTMHITLDHFEGGAASIVGGSLHHADRVVAVSHAVQRDVIRMAPSAATKTVVIHNGVRLPAIEPPPVPLDPPLLVAVGRLHKNKGFDVAIEAFGRIARRHPRLRLLVVGDGPQGGSLRELARGIGVADRVEWLGVRPNSDVALALTRATLVLMPSRYEGFPLVALESGGLGRVVVGARTPGLDEAVEDGRTGVLVPVDDVGALAAAIDALLGDPDHLRELGRAARDRVTTEFSFDRCVIAHDDLYRSLVAL